MSDLDHFATRRDLAAVSGMGSPTYTVGPATSGATFTTIQEAVDAATIAIDAAAITSALILVHPRSAYLEDVLIRCNKIHMKAFGPLNTVTIRSVTVTDATVASVALFNASGLKADLVKDALLTNPPDDNQLESLTFSRDAAVGAWVGLAQSSFRILGSPSALTTFETTGIFLDNCIVAKANGSAAGTGGIYACYANKITFSDSLLFGGQTYEQCASGNCGTLISTSSVQTTWTYDSAGIIPLAAHIGIDCIGCDLKGELEINGDTSKASGQSTYFGNIDNNATAIGSASQFEDCHCEAVLDIGAVGPTVAWSGGEVVLQPTGAGVAGFTQTVRRVACDTVPGTDNTRDLGTTALAFAEVHGRSVQAHADATDTIKTTIAAASITPTVAHTMAPTAAAADTAGKAETVRAGAGGASAAAAGGVGGTASLTGGIGGAGGAAQLAGAGGPIAITAGAAGADGGGGGAAGGNLTLDGGAATGAAVPGKVITTSPFRLKVINKAGRAALGLVAGDAGTIVYVTDGLPAGAVPLSWDGAAWRDMAGNVIA